MTLKKLRKKYKMWLTLAFIFMVLMFVLIGLQIDGWVEVCMGATFFCLVMVIYVMLRYGDAGSATICWTLMSCSMGGTASSAVHLWRMRRRRNADFSEYA